MLTVIKLIIAVVKIMYTAINIGLSHSYEYIRHRIAIQLGESSYYKPLTDKL